MNEKGKTTLKICYESLKLKNYSENTINIYFCSDKCAEYISNQSKTRKLLEPFKNE